MTPADLLTRLRVRPFEPFRIVIADGPTYEVRHPELVMVGLRSASVGWPAQSVAGAVERVDIVSMRHIIRLEEMPQAVSSDPPSGA
jgi:hypothetical protein